jgi:hypothetical protein
MRRVALAFVPLLVALPFLAACGDSPVGRSAAALGGVFAPSDRPPVTRAQAESSPFASILVRVDGGQTAYVVLHSAVGDRLTWLGADRAVLVTQKGRLVSTVGLSGGRIVDTWFGPPDPLAGPVELLDGAAAWRLVDIQPGDVFGFRVDCTMAVTARGPVVILERQYELATVEERCRGSDGRSIVNRFWVDPRTGFVWKSDQWAGPAGRVRIEVLKPLG